MRDWSLPGGSARGINGGRREPGLEGAVRSSWRRRATGQGRERRRHAGRVSPFQSTDGSKKRPGGTSPSAQNQLAWFVYGGFKKFSKILGGPRPPGPPARYANVGDKGCTTRTNPVVALDSSYAESRPPLACGCVDRGWRRQQGCGDREERRRRD